jgi:DNA-binding transcriptional regulator PaaX
MNERLLKKIILEELRKEVTKEGIGDLLRNLIKKEPTISDIMKTFINKNRKANRIFNALKDAPSIRDRVQGYLDEDDYDSAVKIMLRVDSDDMKKADVSDDDYKYLKHAHTEIFAAFKKNKRSIFDDFDL